MQLRNYVEYLSNDIYNMFFVAYIIDEIFTMDRHIFVAHM